MSIHSQFGVLALFAALSLWDGQLNAACPLCERIDRERALEQEKAGPQPIRYYDEARYVGIVDTPSSVTSNPSTSAASSLNTTATPRISPPSETMNKTNTDSSLGFPSEAGTSRGQPSFSSGSINSSTDTGTGQLQSNLNKGSFNQGRLNTTPQTSSYYDPYHDFYIRENSNEPTPGRSRYNENRFYLKETELVPSNQRQQDFIVRGQELSPDQIYSTVFVILQTPNFLKALNGPFTIFIPSNSALRQLSPGTLQGLLRPENQSQLIDIVGDHLVAQKLKPSDLTPRSTIKTVNGTPLHIQSEGDITIVNGARIIRVERLGDNGMVYIVDNLLTP